MLPPREGSCPAVPHRLDSRPARVVGCTAFSSTHRFVGGLHGAGSPRAGRARPHRVRAGLPAPAARPGWRQSTGCGAGAAAGGKGPFQAVGRRPRGHARDRRLLPLPPQAGQHPAPGAGARAARHGLRHGAAPGPRRRGSRPERRPRPRRRDAAHALPPRR